MFRWIIKTGIRCLKRSIPSFTQGAFEGARQASSQSAWVSLEGIQPRLAHVNPFRKFFFGHWLETAVRSTRLKCNPAQRMIGRQRNSASMFLAFAGFAYIGTTDDDCNRHTGTSNSSMKDSLLHNWLQNALKAATENIPEISVDFEGTKLKDYEIGERLGKPSSNSAVYAAKVKDNQAFSKELTVLSHTKKENNTEEAMIKHITLPRHPNIMNICWHFADDVPQLPDAIDMYPAALPTRVYRDGSGRNRTMFLVMARFAGTLSEYISSHQGNLKRETSLALLTQLLEGLAHLNQNDVAHRDLKDDNILVNETGEGFPHLVITDFGCCLAEKELGLLLPFETDETSKGGNIVLMAPEVEYAKPGKGEIIDYSKADEWAAGILAYELFGQKNPFEDGAVAKSTYKSCDLPELTNAPKKIQKLIKQLLQRQPQDRPRVSLAATVCNLTLWAPDLCNGRLSRHELLQAAKGWFRNTMLNLALEMSKYKTKDKIPVEKQMLSTFLCRTSVDEIVEALEWLNPV